MKLVCLSMQDPIGIVSCFVHAKKRESICAGKQASKVFFLRIVFSESELTTQCTDNTVLLFIHRDEY